jgi:hypothetical protein
MRMSTWSFVLLATPIVAVALPRSAVAGCDHGFLAMSGPATMGLRWQGAAPITDIVILNKSYELTQNHYFQTRAIDLHLGAALAGSNCKTMGQINIPGVGSSQDTHYGLSCSTDADCPAGTTRQCQNQHCALPPTPGVFNSGNQCIDSPEILSGVPQGFVGELDYNVYLGVTDSSLSSVPSYPQVGTLDFIQAGSNNGIDGGGQCTSCVYVDPGTSCAYITRIPVYLEDAAVIASLPTLFN